HHRMVFAMNCTDALNMAIKGVIGGLAVDNGRTPHVITSMLEHNSVSRPLQAMADTKQIELTRVDCEDDGGVDPGAVRAAIKSHTVMLVLTHASNVTGTIQDAAAFGAIAREHDLLLLLDAAQTIGVVPIDVEGMQIDLLAFPGHKSLLGPTGTGGLYVGPRCPQPSETLSEETAGRLVAWREGGTGGDSSTPTQPALYPYYLEGGTPNTVGVAGLAAALDEITKKPMQETLAHEQRQCAAIRERFADHDAFTFFGPADASHCVGTLSLNIEGYEASDVGSILDDSFDIAVRPGLHCAPYIHKRLGTYPSGTVRISPGAFNTDEELEQLIDALGQLVE
ncbi:MAG: aminotransferase class V-fold PLP-dependent enzyme, partial [Rhodospirillales bacterium]|nr:aminotransferase class V-fold PLP-dependent enzyme [Rhodospirillales bacterium]